LRFRFSQDIWVLVILLLFLAAAGYFAAARHRDSGVFEVFPRRTTYSSKPGGMKALYETLDKLGYPVIRDLKPLTSPPRDGVLFIVSPETSVSNEEWQALRTWVERGNLLILASDDLTEYMQPAGKFATERSAPACPSFLSPNVASFRVPKDSSILEREWEFGHGDSFRKPFG